MSILKSREEYKSKFMELNNSPVCIFCNPKEEFIIRVYENWTWVFVEFPYFKFHTMLLPKSHALRFSDLTEKELLELAEVLREVEQRYQNREIIGAQSSYGTMLHMSWLSRYGNSNKKFVEHFHLHIWPDVEGSWESILDDKAWDVDIDLLK